MVNLRNKHPDARAGKPLELVHLDLAGAIEPAALDGYRYSFATRKALPTSRTEMGPRNAIGERFSKWRDIC